MAIGVGTYVRFAVGANPPPGVDVNANSAMIVTAVAQTERGGMVTVARENKTVGYYPQSIMVEVRAPPGG